MLLIPCEVTVSVVRRADRPVLLRTRHFILLMAIYHRLSLIPPARKRPRLAAEMGSTRRL
jgi:hypothetical protein